MRYRALLPLLAAALLSAVPLSAQSAYILPHVTGTVVGVEGTAPVVGAGFGLTLGYRISDRISLFAGWDKTPVNVTDLSATHNLLNVDLGGRYAFRAAAGRIGGFVSAAVTATVADLELARERDGAVSVPDALEAEGTGLTVGAGLEWPLSESSVLHAALQMTAGRMAAAESAEWSGPLEPNLRQARFTFGGSVSVGR